MCFTSSSKRSKIYRDINRSIFTKSCKLLSFYELFSIEIIEGDYHTVNVVMQGEVNNAEE